MNLVLELPANPLFFITFFGCAGVAAAVGVA